MFSKKVNYLLILFVLIHFGQFLKKMCQITILNFFQIEKLSEIKQP